ncbi:MAG: single-stranded DNA-binding protein [Actinomycetota bacterium]|nr:single-stranded DNA-binding protein [Actinomycetota bacterium]
MTKPRRTGDKTSGPDEDGPDRAGPGMNVVLLKGRLSRPAELRVLPSGDRLVALELSVTRPGLKTESVPVVWHDAPAVAEAFDVDQPVVVLGRVRRRFFRTGGGTQSRTEVVAESVVPARQSKRAGTLVARAMVLLDTADP